MGERSPVQRICKRVGILVKGKVVAEGPLEELGKKAFGRGKYSVVIELTEVTPDIVKSVKKIKGVQNIEETGNTLIVDCASDIRSKIAKTIMDNNGMLVKMNVESFALEDIYLKYFGEG